MTPALRRLGQGVTLSQNKLSEFTQKEFLRHRRKRKAEATTVAPRLRKRRSAKGDLLPTNILGDSVSGTPSPFPPSRASHPGISHLLDA